MGWISKTICRRAKINCNVGTLGYKCTAKIGFDPSMSSQCHAYKHGLHILKVACHRAKISVLAPSMSPKTHIRLLHMKMGHTYTYKQLYNLQHNKLNMDFCWYMLPISFWTLQCHPKVMKLLVLQPNMAVLYRQIWPLFTSASWASKPLGLMLRDILLSN